MIVFTRTAWEKLYTYLFVLALGLLLVLCRHWTLFAAVGCMFLVYAVADIVGGILGRLIGHMLFKRVVPNSVEEVKHSDKAYQYIVEIKGEKRYTQVYRHPLKEVQVECWIYGKMWFIEVRKIHYRLFNFDS